MLIHFECPHCGVATRVHVSQAGESGPCRNCGETVVVPGDPQSRADRPAKASAWKLLAICVLIATPLVIGLMAIVLGVSAFRGFESETESLNNLRRIVQAMREYEEVHGHLPPAYIADANGKPMHSWRVLLLQYMGPQEQALFKEYKMDEPWNGPNNTLLHARMPKVYGCPGAYQNNNCTSYVVVVGKETAFEGARPVKSSEIKDLASTTILVLDVGRTDIVWAAPRDLEFRKMPDLVGTGVLASHHDKELHVGMADGTAQKLSDRVEISPWLTKSAGDKPSR